MLIRIAVSLLLLPSTLGEKIIKLSYKNAPYLDRAKVGSSAVLNSNVSPNPERQDIKIPLVKCSIGDFYDNAGIKLIEIYKI